MNDIPFGTTEWAQVEPTERELHTELDDGRRFSLQPGMSYQVGDHAEAHRSSTDVGARLYIVD